MAVSAITPELVTLKEARDFLGEQQIDPDIAGNLQRVLNSVVGWVYEYLGRYYIAYDANVDIVEYVRGRGDHELWLRETPVRSVSEVITYPMYDTLGYTITGPGAAYFNDDMYYNPDTGQAFLKTYEVPDMHMAAKVTYKAGYDATAPELFTIKGATLELLQFHWQRHVNNDPMISSKTQGDDSITFRTDDIDPAVLRQLRPYRREWTA